MDTIGGKWQKGGNQGHSKQYIEPISSRAKCSILTRGICSSLPMVAGPKTYTKARLAHPGSSEERFASNFVLKLLKKRLFSSPRAFAQTLEHHRYSLLHAERRAAHVYKPSVSILAEKIAEIEEEYESDKVLEESVNDAIDVMAPPKVSTCKIIAHA